MVLSFMLLCFAFSIHYLLFQLFFLMVMCSVQEMGSQENEECLPPPPPIVPADIEPIKIEPQIVKKKLPTKVPMARRGLGSKGAKLPLLTNHFKVNVTNTDGYFFQYSVSIV